MNEKTVRYWVDIANYDLKTAYAMLKSKRYLYVGFMCHQSIEKLLKAYYVKRLKDIPPYTHNLLLLAEKSGIYQYFSEEQKDLLDELEPLNIEARYPKNKKILFRILSNEKCKIIIKETEELFKWIMGMLKKK